MIEFAKVISTQTYDLTMVSYVYGMVDIYKKIILVTESQPIEEYYYSEWKSLLADHTQARMYVPNNNRSYRHIV